MESKEFSNVKASVSSTQINDQPETIIIVHDAGVILVIQL